MKNFSSDDKILGVHECPDGEGMHGVLIFLRKKNMSEYKQVFFDPDEADAIADAIKKAAKEARKLSANPGAAKQEKE